MSLFLFRGGGGFRFVTGFVALFGSLPGAAQFFGTDTHGLIHLL
jgi:hypothetical protein